MKLQLLLAINDSEIEGLLSSAGISYIYLYDELINRHKVPNNRTSSLAPMPGSVSMIIFFFFMMAVGSNICRRRCPTLAYSCAR